MVVSHLDTPKPKDPGPSVRPDGFEPRWTCALVNNMPDSAFDETERQFLNLLDESSGTEILDTRLYALGSIPRGELTAQRIAERYSPIAEIYDNPPDVLIMTGANPVEPVIQNEPQWADMVTLLSWASEHVQSMLLSCMSAHAALTIYDGIERGRLAAKCTGVFAQKADPVNMLTGGLGSAIVLPHSRLNSVPVSEIRAAGYDVPLYSDDIGWSVATRFVERARVVLVQAHPEYGPTSLLREYHRDARRYVLRERDELPALPLHCVAPDDWESLQKLHDRIANGERDPVLVASFPFDEIGARALWPWRTVATRLYANWLAGVPMRSE